MDELLAQGANVQMVEFTVAMVSMKAIKVISSGRPNFQRQRGKSYGSRNYPAFWPIDGLVNNAGVNFPRLLVDEKRLPGSMNSTKLHSKKWSISTERRFSDVAGGGATDGQTT